MQSQQQLNQLDKLIEFDGIKYKFAGLVPLSLVFYSLSSLTPSATFYFDKAENDLDPIYRLFSVVGNISGSHTYMILNIQPNSLLSVSEKTVTTASGCTVISQTLNNGLKMYIPNSVASFSASEEFRELILIIKSKEVAKFSITVDNYTGFVCYLNLWFQKYVVFNH